MFGKKRTYSELGAIELVIDKTIALLKEGKPKDQKDRDWIIMNLEGALKEHKALCAKISQIKQLTDSV